MVWKLRTIYSIALVLLLLHYGGVQGFVLRFVSSIGLVVIVALSLWLVSERKEQSNNTESTNDTSLNHSGI